MVSLRDANTLITASRYQGSDGEDKTTIRHPEIILLDSARETTFTSGTRLRAVFSLITADDDSHKGYMSNRLKRSCNTGYGRDADTSATYVAVLQQGECAMHAMPHHSGA
jgi:hypothetical protein